MYAETQMLADPTEVVTPRQLELLAMYASGHTLDEIASVKFLATNTVRQNLRLARERVGARSLTHLCVVCVEAGILVRNGTGFKPVQPEGVVGE